MKNNTLDTQNGIKLIDWAKVFEGGQYLQSNAYIVGLYYGMPLVGRISSYEITFEFAYYFLRRTDAYESLANSISSARKSISIGTELIGRRNSAERTLRIFVK